MKLLPLTSSDLQATATVVQNRGSEVRTFLWSAAGFASFTVSWKYTHGGYTCCLPLLVLLVLYCCVYSSHLVNISIGKTVVSEVWSNLHRLAHHGRRDTALIVIYWLVKVSLSIWYPKGEGSNGSPFSLIFFTILFITIYIVPNAVSACFSVYNPCLRKRSRDLSLRMSKEVFCSGWNRSVVFIICLVVLTYICDGDITSILCYVGRGRPCWPLLIPNSMRDTLPYPLQHAWIKTWHNVFSGYRPSRAVTAVIALGREMGEVCRLLPVLIGTYVFAQLCLPRKHHHIKVTLFACIAGVVLGGVTSGSFKILLHRYRPNAYGDPYMWKGPGTAVVNHLHFSKLDLSFPAGHTTVTSAVATCLYQALLANHRYLKLSNCLKLWLILCMYFYPFVVMVSRVSECYHWTSDATFGLFLGYVLGHVITSKLHGRLTAESYSTNEVIKANVGDGTNTNVTGTTANGMANGTASNMITNIKALWDDLVAANQEGTELFAHQDMKGLVSHYTADATLMFPGLDVIQGRDGIEQHLGKFYEMGATQMVLETKEVGSLGASDEMAFERGYNRIVSDDGQLLVNGKYVTLWKKLEGQWFIYCSIYTSNT